MPKATRSYGGLLIPLGYQGLVFTRGKSVKDSNWLFTSGLNHGLPALFPGSCLAGSAHATCYRLIVALEVSSEIL